MIFERQRLLNNTHNREEPLISIGVNSPLRWTDFELLEVSKDSCYACALGKKSKDQSISLEHIFPKVNCCRYQKMSQEIYKAKNCEGKFEPGLAVRMPGDELRKASPNSKYVQVRNLCRYHNTMLSDLDIVGRNLDTFFSYVDGNEEKYYKGALKGKKYIEADFDGDSMERYLAKVYLNYHFSLKKELLKPMFRSENGGRKIIKNLAEFVFDDQKRPIEHFCGKGCGLYIGKLVNQRPKDLFGGGHTRMRNQFIDEFELCGVFLIQICKQTTVPVGFRYTLFGYDLILYFNQRVNVNESSQITDSEMYRPTRIYNRSGQKERHNVQLNIEWNPKWKGREGSREIFLCDTFCTTDRLIGEKEKQ